MLCAPTMYYLMLLDDTDVTTSAKLQKLTHKSTKNALSSILYKLNVYEIYNFFFSNFDFTKKKGKSIEKLCAQI